MQGSQQGVRGIMMEVRSSVLHPSDPVLVQTRGGTGKLHNHWEYNIHVVICQAGEDIPVYEVKLEQGGQGSRIMHRNLLLPCEYLPLRIQQKAPSKQKYRRMIGAYAENTNKEEEDN